MITAELNQGVQDELCRAFELDQKQRSHLDESITPIHLEVELLQQKSN